MVDFLDPPAILLRMPQTLDSTIAGFRNSTHYRFPVADLEETLHRIFPNLSQWRGPVRHVVENDSDLGLVIATVDLFTHHMPTVEHVDGHFVVVSPGFDALNAGEV